jgi:drug/metabolite transporter superfamily protein YnfA
MPYIRYGYLILAILCFALAVFDHNYRDFAAAGGLFVVAEAILQLRDRSAP